MGYLQYKDVESLWMTQIPSSWNYKLLRSVFYERKESNDPVKITEILSLSAKHGVQLYSDKKHEGGNRAKDDLTKYHIAHPGDLIVNCMNIVSGSVGLSKYTGLISPVYYALVTRSEDYNRYYYSYLFSLETFQKSLLPLGKGILMHESSTGKLNTVRMRISMSSFNNVPLPVPPREEQNQIVRYLDWQLSKINKLIHGYQREIKLLEERKTAIINNAVTKGLDPDVEYKSVESNWTGDIPSHWDFGAIKQHFQIQKRIAGKEGYDVLSITQQGLKIKDVASNEGQIAASYANYQFVYPGDFAMNHMDLLTGYVGLSEYFGVTSPDYRVFTITDTDNCNPEYYLYIFQLCYRRRIFYGLGKGAASKGRWRMPAINFKNFGIPIPPMKEQIEIVAFIKEQEKKIGELIEGIEKNIEALKEYRTRLISDVVTGQMDVRGIEIPDYMPEEETDISDEAEDTDDMESEVSGDE